MNEFSRRLKYGAAIVGRERRTQTVTKARCANQFQNTIVWQKSAIPKTSITVPVTPTSTGVYFIRLERCAGKINATTYGTRRERLHSFQPNHNNLLQTYKVKFVFMRYKIGHYAAIL